MTRRVALLIGAAALLLIAGSAIPLLVFNFQSDAPPSEAEEKTATCETGVSVYFESDSAMHAAATALEDDDRVADVRAETRLHASDRLRRDVLRRPDADPAEILDKSDSERWLLPAVHLAADGPKAPALADELGSELSDVTAAQAANCASVSVDDKAMTALVDVRCSAELKVLFRTDKKMVQAATTLADNKRVSVDNTQTKKQAYEKAAETFEDDPEVSELITPDAMNASIEVSVLEGDSDDVARDLRERFGASHVHESSCYGIVHPVATD